jgi:hypothetical protein
LSGLNDRLVAVVDEIPNRFRVQGNSLVPSSQASHPVAEHPETDVKTENHQIHANHVWWYALESREFEQWISAARRAAEIH